jgi:enoyl-CoA hydratase/carnithine racemase
MSERNDERVQWEIREGIGILTLNNPPENYLYEPAFVSQKTLETWTNDPSLKGILIHGAGKHFSAGGDLKRLSELIDNQVNLPEMMAGGNAIADHLISLKIPLVAAIHGICFGGGLELALACHIRIAGERALFAFPESGHGLMPGLGGTLRLPATSGTGQAVKMILSGDMIDAEEAKMIHLIDEIVPRSEVFDHAFQLLLKMTRDVPLHVIRSVIQALNNAETLSPEEAIKEETRMFCELALQESQNRKNLTNS